MLDLLLHPAAYAEDQQYSKLILSTHVIHRGFNLGAIVGIGASLARTGYYKARPSKATFPIPYGSTPLSQTLRFAARGGLFGLAFGALALGGRMYSKSLIEWQDRSWRLLQHSTQNQTDHWSLIGAGLGVIAHAALYRSASTPMRLFGAGALGSSSAIVLMMISRGFKSEL
jgi:hypothetical protein